MRLLLQYCLLPILLLMSLQGSAQSDPGLPGSLAVSKDTFNLGDLAYTPSGLSKAVELRGSVHYPSVLSGPYPVIVLLHGRHSTCYQVSNPHNTSITWPCASGFAPITSFEGYDYFARNMASHGYIVVSVSCNAINGYDASLPDRGMRARSELVQHHLDLWNTWNTTGGAPFGTKFTGQLDMQNIGTMGHSRGGEGVIHHALLNRSLGSPYGIRAVLTLAPVNFAQKVLNNIPVLNIAPYCDGDVFSLDGVHYYDDARYNDLSDSTAKYSIMMLGANHNFFNTVWTPGAYIAGTGDDWFINTDEHCASSKPGNKRFDTTKQKAVFNTYASAFFRLYQEKDTNFAQFLETRTLTPPPSALADSSEIFVSWHPAAGKRQDINRTNIPATVLKNNLGGTVGSYSLSPAPVICVDCGSVACKPHEGSTGHPGLSQWIIEWDHDTGYCYNDIPVLYQDISSFRSLQFRMAIDFSSSLVTPAPMDFQVQLVDNAGMKSSIKVSDHSYVPRFLTQPPGTTPGLVPKLMPHTVMLPLSAFTGVDLTAIRSVRFLLNNPDSGSIMISDISLSGSTDQCKNLKTRFGYKEDKGYELDFMDSTKVPAGDTLVRLWKFGDPLSGTSDTSTLVNPAHIFSAPGTYTVCLYITLRKGTGLVCRDSLCKSITVLPSHINDPAAQQLLIVPNPAKDLLFIYGGNAGDVLELLDMQGHHIERYPLSGSYYQLRLPALAPGLYLARITTASGSRLVRKIQIRP